MFIYTFFKPIEFDRLKVKKQNVPDLFALPGFVTK